MSKDDPRAGETQNTGDILRDFAHEIRTPLNAMIGYSGLIRMELAGGKDLDKLRDYNETIEASTLRLLRICERVLDDAILGGRSIVVTPFDAADLATSVAATFGQLAKERGVTLEVNFPKDFPELLSDPLLVSQVLSNLISNALKFTPKGGSVSIVGEINATQDAVIFVIRDTGAGIPADLLLRIRRGERVTTAKSKKLKGWGRGLKIAEAICRSLSAELTFTQAENGGTVVLFLLPISTGNAEPD